MKPNKIVFISATACLVAVAVSSWLSASEKTAFGNSQLTEQTFENNMPILFAEAGDETERLDRDRPPSSKPRPDSERGRGRDGRPRGGRWRDGKEEFGPGMESDRDMRPPDDDQGFGPGMRRGRDQNRGGPHGEFMTQTEIEELMNFAKEQFPEIYERLKNARDTDPRSFRHMLRRIGEPIFRVYRIYKHDPNLAKIMIAEHKTKLTIFTLQRDYRQATSETEKTSIKTELHAQLVKQFECRQQRLKLEIENLRKRLDEQAKRLEESEKNKEVLINNELQKTIDKLEGKSLF